MPRAALPSRCQTRCSIEGLSATESLLDLVPVVDPVLAELPAEVDLAALAHRGEVDQPAVDVAYDDAGFLEAPEQAADLEESLADGPAVVAATVGRRGLAHRL